MPSTLALTDDPHTVGPMPSADSFSSPGHDSRTGAATDTGSGIGSPAGADSGTPTTEIDWVTAFVDIPDAVHRICTEFWSSVTGSQLSASRGDHGQFATLLPDSGDAYLRVQNTGHGGTGVHIDLHVQDRPTMVGRVRALGGREHTDYGDVQVMTSPVACGSAWSMPPIRAGPRLRRSGRGIAAGSIRW